MQITNFIKGGNLRCLFIISLFFLMLVNPVSADVVNGGFESGTVGWSITGLESTTLGEPAINPQEGVLSLALFNSLGVGNSSASQTIDVSGIRYISVWSNMDGYGGSLFFYIDDELQYEANYPVEDVWYNYLVDVADINGNVDFMMWNSWDGFIWLDNITLLSVASAASPAFDDVSWDYPEYFTGETAHITTEILDYDGSTYTYFLDLYSEGEYLDTFEIAAEVETNDFVFPTSWMNRGLLAQLNRVTNPYATNEVLLDYETSLFTTTQADTAPSNIVFEKTQAYTDEQPKILYYIAPTDWEDTWLGFGYTFYINYKDTSDSEYTSIKLNDRQGSKYIIPDIDDTFIIATLTKNWKDLPDSAIYTPTILSTDEINILSVVKTGGITVNDTSVRTGDTFNITYYYGYYPTAPSITIKRLVDDAWSDDFMGWIGLDDYDPSTFYTIQHSIAQESKYLIELRDGGLVLKSVVIDVVYGAIPPTSNITTSNIFTNKDTYQFGAAIYTEFVIDNTNYSNYAVFLDIYNNDKGVLSYHLPVYSQVDNHFVSITGTHNIDTNWGFFTIPNPLFYSGNNTIKLAAYDLSSGAYVSDIIAKYITIDTVTTAGYGLTVSDNEISEGESVIINYIVPSASTFKIVRSSTQEIMKEMSVNSSDSIRYTFEDFGIYYIELHSTNYLEVSTQIVVDDIDEEDDGVTTEDGFSTAFDDMIASSAFSGLLIIVGCVGAFDKCNRPLGTLVGAVVGISIACTMLLLPWWILFVIVLIIIIIGVSMLVSGVLGGGK